MGSWKLSQQSLGERWEMSICLGQYFSTSQEPHVHTHSNLIGSNQHNVVDHCIKYLFTTIQESL